MTKKLTILLLLISSLTALVSVAENDRSNANTKTVFLCIQCHGKEGNATIPGWPPISSMNKNELVSKLKGYRAKSNPESRMSDVTHALNDSQIDDVANYFSRRPKPSEK